MWRWCIFSLAVVFANTIANDFCTGAITLTPGSGTGTNVNAIEQRQVEGIYGDDVFYKYVATKTGWATFTVQSTIRLGIAVFYGSSCAKPGPEGYYPNRTYTYSSCNQPVDLTWPVFSGSTYYFAVGSYNCGEGATFTWNLAETLDATPTAGDSCRTPLQVPASGFHTASIDGATKQDYYFYGDSDIFWSYTANCTGVATATATSTFSNVLQYYYSQSCDDVLGTDNRFDYDSNGNSSIAFNVISGRSYLIAGGPYSPGSSGNIDLAVSCAAKATASNDICNSATSVTTSFTTSTTNANTNFNDNWCYYSPYNEVWLNHTATCTGKLALHINNTYVGIARGASCDSAQLIYCGYDTDHTIDVTAGDVLLIAVGDGAGDTLVGTITCTPYNTAPPQNTRCAGASVATSAIQTFPTANSLTDPLSNRYHYTQGYFSCSSLNFETFFTYTATCTGSVVFNLNSTDGTYNLGFVLYQDSSCSANVEPAICDNDATYSGAGSYGPLNVNQNDVYYFGVTYYDSAAVRTNIQVSVTCTGTSSGTSAPTTSGSTAAPTTSGSTAAPTTSGSTKAPTVGSTAAPTTTGSKAPTTTGSTSAPTNSGGTSAPTDTTTTSAPTGTTTNGAGAVGFGFVTMLAFLLF